MARRGHWMTSARAPRSSVAAPAARTGRRARQGLAGLLGLLLRVGEVLLRPGQLRERGLVGRTGRLVHLLLGLLDRGLRLGELADRARALAGRLEGDRGVPGVEARVPDAPRLAALRRSGRIASALLVA